MSEVTLFENNALANTDLYKSLQDINDNLLGGSGGSITRRRISLKGGRFREMVNGEEHTVSPDSNINVIIVGAAPLSRTYYSGAYDPQNPSAPTCWSSDTQTPASDVPDDQKQSARCMDCSMNIRGSGQGDSRACRFSQRLAVVLEGQFDKVYQLQLPATSIFGNSGDGKMPMQAYARFLAAHSTPAIAIVTNIRFDGDSSTPKLFFKAVRPLTEDELSTVVALKEHPDTQMALALTVAQTDKREVAPAPEAKPKSKAKTSGGLFDSAPDSEEVEEPKKVVKKAAPAPASNNDLSEIIENWDD
jgi:hypothetical protein